VVHVHKKKGTQMRTNNFAQRKDSRRLPIVYCLVICFVLVGCTYKILNTFDGIEAEALKYGTVSVGAVRVVDYNNVELESAREELTKALKNMRKTLTATPDIAPQTFLLNYDMKNRTFNLSLSGSKEKSAQAGESKQSSQGQSQKEALVDLSKIFQEMIKAQGPRPSETEMIGLRMAEIKEGKKYTKEEVKKFLKEIKEYTEGDFLKDWNQLIEEEFKDGFKSLDELKKNEPNKKFRDKEKGRGDWVAFCHSWLKKNEFFPRIVNVERMGKAEYLILAESDYRSTEFGIGAAHPGIPVSVDTKLQSAEQTQQVTASVRPLSLAFIAGNRRAGWLFMPSKTKDGVMPPTERRLRMVVDIPDKMKKLNIHVHKVFLCPKLGVLPGAKFKKQMENLDKARRILTEADKLYKKSIEGKPPCSSPRHYRLIKTRMRNLLYQGWSEEIAVSIPEERKKG